MSKGKLLAVCAVWLVIFGVGAMAWRWFVAPTYRKVAERRAERQREELLDATSADGHFQHHVNFALDAFSGYAVLRSAEFQDFLSQKRIRVEIHDDGANYAQRLQDLKAGNIQMAAFTIDALIKVSAEIDGFPATIVAIIDETRGADAMVADREVIPNIEALNRADMRLHLTPDSPSETLARVVMADFSLNDLSDDAFVAATGPEEVLAAYRGSKPKAAEAYVLWEPYVSRIRSENPNMHVVIDSSWFRGYIVDVIVASRDYLAKNEDVVRDVVGCYFRAAYQHRNGMVDLVKRDGRLKQSEAENLVNGIQWKNTQENFSHLDLSGVRPLQHIEGMISRITDVLTNTGAIEADPTGGKPTMLYYDKVLRELQTSNFHPGLDDEVVQEDRVVLPRLSESDWGKLNEIGEFRVPKLVFAPGTDTLRSYSQTILDDLAGKLKTWPRAYVFIRGNVSARGNAEANRRLAQQRAEVAAQYLIKQDVHENRVRATTGEETGTTVSFVLGQPSY